MLDLVEPVKDRIETPHLTLLKATIPLLAAEKACLDALERCREVEMKDLLRKMQDEFWPLARAFEELLGAHILDSWRIHDDDDSGWWMDHYPGSNADPRWGKWYFLLKRRLDNYPNPMAIGNGGFKGPPSKEGIVQIGYLLLGRFRVVDLASEAVGGLVAHAFEHPQVQRVIAETSAKDIPSIRALGKNGFMRAGRGGEPDSIRFHRDREAAS